MTTREELELTKKRVEAEKVKNERLSEDNRTLREELGEDA